MLGAEAKRTFITSSLITPTTYLNRCEPLTHWVPRKELFRISLLQVMRGDSDFFYSYVSPEEKYSPSGWFAAMPSFPLSCICVVKAHRRHFLRKMISTLFKCMVLRVYLSVISSQIEISS